MGNKALLPGFIDAHGHITAQARLFNYVNIFPPPVGEMESVADIVASLKAHLAEQNPAPGTWVVGFGYDDSLLAERRHPTRDDLDQVSSRHPIYLTHVSGHLGAANSAALAAAGIDADTENPDGGLIRRRPGSLEPNGVLEEAAVSPFHFHLVPEAFKDVKFEELMTKAIGYFASYGITTIQDGATMPDDLAALRAMAERGKIGADIVVYPPYLTLEQEDFSTLTHEPEFTNGLRVGGVKFALDGSPQGRTAWMMESYHELPAGAEPGYVAYPSSDPDFYRKNVALLIQRGVPVLVHANGDAAIDLMMDGNALKDISVVETIARGKTLYAMDMSTGTGSPGIEP